MAEDKTLLFYVEAIPHKNQRYETCGDWQFLPNGLHVSVSDTGNRMSNMLVGLHELVEAILCEAKGVSGADVDHFDMAFEKARQLGNFDEPGDDPRAPYHDQHKIADIVERIVAQAAGIGWRAHEARVDALCDS